MLKLAGIVGAIVAFLAGIANILTYLEQSQRFPEVVAMLSAIISFDLLRLCTNLALVAAVLIALWRQNKLLALFSDHVLKTDAHARTKELLPLLKANQIIYPAERGMLWEWSEKEGAAGPFCPVHGTPLVYKDYMKHVQPEFDDTNFLGGTGRFACFADNTDFVFYEPPTLRVGELRSQAATMLRATMNQRSR
jgi:hypothetical protein